MTPYYQDDACTIYCGDCRDVLPGLGRGESSAMIVDPPYAIVNQFGTQSRLDGNRVLQFEWDGPECLPVVIEGLRLGCESLPKTAAVFAFAGLDSIGATVDVIRSFGFTVKPAAWVKECPAPACKGNWWPSGFEIACYAYRGSPYFGDANPKRSNVFYSDSYRHGQPGKVDHPTQKPLGMIRHIIQSVVPVGGQCLDPFMGSGTTLVAAKLEGRRAVGIELNEKYCEIAANRLAQGVLF